jgi:hypothetical protein
MPGQFDPYHKWLGIPPEEQPPHHYRLLGIEAFETDADVISNSADQRMLHVRSFQNGPQRDVSQKLLNEIAAARVCLLSDPRRQDYDAQLRSRLASKPSARPSGPPPLVARPVKVPVATPVVASTDKSPENSPQELLKEMVRDRFVDPMRITLRAFSAPPWLLMLGAAVAFTVGVWLFVKLVYLFDQAGSSGGGP